MGKPLVPKSSCAPYKKTDEISCYETKELEMLRSKFNSSHPENQIPSGLSRKELWKRLFSSMKSKESCKTEYCWARKYGVGKDNFRPELPEEWKEKPTTWLSNFDIDAVMKQYEKAFPEFIYLGTVPIDFDKKVSTGQCIVNKICHISLKELKSRGKSKIGAIFNLDRHDQPGSHWVAMFYNISDGDIFYWDSYGMKPPKEVAALMKRLEKQAHELNCDQICKTPRLFFNNIRHQRKYSECGMYSIYFITELLQGRDFGDVIKTIVPDDTVNSYRKLFFVDGGRRRDVRTGGAKRKKTSKNNLSILGSVMDIFRSSPRKRTQKIVNEKKLSRNMGILNAIESIMRPRIVGIHG